MKLTNDEMEQENMLWIKSVIPEPSGFVMTFDPAVDEKEGRERAHFVADILTRFMAARNEIDEQTFQGHVSLTDVQTDEDGRWVSCRCSMEEVIPPRNIMHMETFITGERINKDAPQHGKGRGRKWVRGPWGR